MDDIYENYLVKCEIFNRDKFTCQNIGCNSPDSELTWHHIKKRSNGGENKARNGVTLCDRCHKNFHRAKIPLVFDNSENLPPQIRGHTLWEHTENEYDWKQHKKEMRELRKDLIRTKQVTYMSWEQIYILLAWLGW